MKNRNFLLLFLFMSSVFFGCTEGGNTITILGESSASLNAISDIKDKYSKLTGDSIVTKGFTLEEAMEKANVDFANGTGKYDVIMQYNFSLSSFVRNNYVYNLQELSDAKQDSTLDFENDLFRNAWEEVGFYYKNPKNPDTNYVKVGYPFASNTLVMVYNKAMFENNENQSDFKKKYGYDLQPPMTWPQLRDMAEYFTRKDKKSYGICLQGGAGGWLYYEWAMFAYGMDGGVMQKNHGWEGDLKTPFLLTSLNTIKATELYLSLKPYNKGDFFNVDATAQIKEVLKGDVALAFVWSDYLQSAFYNRSSQQYDNRFGFSTIPGKKSPLAGGAFFINRKSKNPKSAFNFTKWLLNKDNQIQMVKSGLSSPCKSVYDAAEVQYIPYIKALKESLVRGVYMFEAGPDADLINSKLTTWMQKAWKGEISARLALENAYDEISKERIGIFNNINNK